MMERGQINEFRKLFSLEHLVFDFLPKRIAIYVIPPGIVIAILLGSQDLSYKFFFVGYCVLMTLAQISNYFMCWHRHIAWEARYGDQYRAKLEVELQRFGLNGLIGRLWSDLRMRP